MSETSKISLLGKKYLKEAVFLENFLQIEGDKISPELFNLIFDIIIATSNSQSKVGSQDVDFFVILLHLLVRCERNIQVNVVKSFLSLLKEKPSLLLYGTNKDWLKILIKSLPQFKNETVLVELFGLVKALSVENFTIHHVKKIFDLFRPNEEGPFKAFFWSHIIQVLDVTWNTSGGPDCYFELEGNASGLIVPPITRWPANGYTFCTWVRITSWSSPYINRATPFTPYVFAFTSDTGIGIECYFDRHKLAFRAMQKKGKPKNYLTNFTFQERVWYCIGIIHKPGFIMGRSQIRLFIDGKLIEAFNLSYPKPEKSMSVCRLGISTSIPDQPAHSLRGRMGGALMLEEPLSDESMAAMQMVGGNLFANIQGMDKVLSSIRTGILKANKPRVLFYYSPKAVEGKVLCCDIISRDRTRQATKFADVKEFRARRLQTSFYCIGGINILLPLFSMKYRPKNTNFVDLNIQLIKLITKMISNNEYYRNSMQRTQFFPIMGYLLSTENPSLVEDSGDGDQSTQSFWTPESISSLDILANIIMGNEYLFHQFYSNVILNFKIWSKTSFEVQQNVLNSISARASANPREFKKRVPVSYLFEILSQFYSVNDKTVKRRNSLSSITLTNTVRNELTKQQLQTLRIIILSIVKTLVQDEGITFNELKCIILYLETESLKSPKNQRCIDVLQLIITLLKDKVKGIYENLANFGYFLPFFSLLQKDNNTLCIWTMKVLGILLLHVLKEPNMDLVSGLNNTENIQAASTTSSSSSSSSSIDPIVVDEETMIKNRAEILSIFNSMKKIIEHFTLTYNMYTVILEIVVGRISAKGVENVVDIYLKGKSSGAKVPDIEVPELLPTIFSLLHISTDVDLKTKILSELLTLLTNSYHNKHLFLKIKNWQNWLLTIVAKEVEDHSTTSSPTIPKENKEDEGRRRRDASAYLFLERNSDNHVFGLVVKIYATLFFHVMQTCDGSHIFTETRSMMNDFKRMGIISSTKLIRSINNALCELLGFVSFEGRSKMLESCLSDPKQWVSTAEWLLFVEESMFFIPENFSFVRDPTNTTSSSSITSTGDNQVVHPKSTSSLNQKLYPLQVDRDNAGLWNDVNFAHRLLDFISSFATKAPIISTPAMVSSEENEKNQGISYGGRTLTHKKVVLIQERLKSFHLRLMLYLLNEASRFQNYYNLESRRDKFKALHALVASQVSQNELVIQSINKYLEGKTKQWDVESSDISNVFTTTQKSIAQYINSLRIKPVETAIERLFYILCCMNYIIEDVPQSNQLLQKTLQEMFSKCAVVIIEVLDKLGQLPQSLKDAVSNESQSKNVMFESMKNQSHPLFDKISGSVSAITGKEINERMRIDNELETLSENVRITKENITMSEIENHQNIISKQKLLREKLRIQNEKIQRRSDIERKQMEAHLGRMWNYLQRQLTHSRGVWSTLSDDASEKVYWKLDTKETKNKRRLRLVRCYGDMSHVEYANNVNLKIVDYINPKSVNKDSVNNVNSPLMGDKDLKKGTNLPHISSEIRMKSKVNLLEDQKKSDSENLIEEKKEKFNLPSFIRKIDDLLDDEDYIPTNNLEDKSTSQDNLKKVDDMSVNDNEETIQEKSKHIGDCLWIKGMKSVEGEFEISSKAFYFRNLEKNIFFSIPIDTIRRIYRRSYMLRQTALEIFTIRQKSYFLSFDKWEVSKTLKVLLKLKPPVLEDDFSLSPEKLFKKSNITELWRRRVISNFDYLMELNTIAGRSYNDLSQYPVFPWIIADYESPTLDLNDPKVYRDLTKPIGALNPDRLEKLLERYKQTPFSQMDMPPFLYGTHYSSAAIVLFYLLRIEPFTTAFLNLQDGKFDHPMRMFWSIAETWNGCLNNPMDVKEMIPEFYYNPDFLTNQNNLVLGKINTSSTSSTSTSSTSTSTPSSTSSPSLPPSDQTTTTTTSSSDNGTPIENVILPPWANGCPQNFVQINRKALESDYVSANLHHWIDLIFGYKQTGEAAEQSHNIFYYLTYEGAVDIDAIEDPLQRGAITSQIKNFGQTPVQILQTPHPRRLSIEEAAKENMSLTEVLSDGLNVVANILTTTPSSPTLSTSSSTSTTQGGSSNTAKPLPKTPTGKVMQKMASTGLIKSTITKKEESDPLEEIFTFNLHPTSQSSSSSSTSSNQSTQSTSNNNTSSQSNTGNQSTSGGSSTSSSSVVNETVPLVFMEPYKSDKLLLVFQDGYVIKATWKGFSRTKVNIQGPSDRNSIPQFPFLFSHQSNMNLLNNLFSFNSDMQVLFSGGHWDDSMHCSNVTNGLLLAQTFDHHDTGLTS
eukprot:TRINITY_DN1880_c1_g2_i4.p1 TRINITY_DN1880_c1_g2~~TRINITY_DN1880_c1_g2_i4.p1  ORF type:complete len:2284 (+),score=559.04 TRINITY_DN1880_c1_g2_i4:47-6898(+)